MINRIFVAFTAIILFSLAACSKEHPIERGPVIAKIGNEYLYLYDMIPEGNFPSFWRKDVNFRKNRLKIYVINEMYNREGYSRGLHKTEAVQEKLIDHMDKNMPSVVYKKIVLEKFANEKSLRKLYGRLKKRVSARHILISYNVVVNTARNVDRTKNDALNLISNIRLKIASKDDFIAFANDISEDQTSTDGGDLGFFEWGQMEDSFQETAFSIEPNSVSEPVETSFGFHLIWVDSVKNITLKPFNQMQAELKNKIYTINRNEIKLAAEKFVDSLNVAARMIFNDTNFEFLLNKISEFNSSKNKQADRQSLINFLMSVELPGPLVTYIDNGVEKAVSTEQIVNLIKNPSSGWSIDRITDVQPFKNVIKDEINGQLIKQFGFYAKFEEDDNVRKDLKKKEHDLMRQELTKIEVANKVFSDDEKLLKYYNEHKDKYVSSGVSDIVEILVTKKSVVDSLYNLVSNGQDMFELASSYSERISAVENKGILRDITRVKLPPIGMKVASMDVGELSEPIKVGTKWSFFKVISNLPPGYKPYENVKHRVSLDFKHDEKKRLTAMLEDYLKDKYSPKYYFENLIPEITEGNVE